MGKSLIKGTLLGAIVLYIWMMISWMVLPWHCSALQKFSSEESVAAVIAANAAEDGVYTLPNMCGQNKEEHMAATKKGPLVFATVRKGGYDFTSPRPYIISFIIQLIGAFFVTYLLLQARDMSYWHRVWFVTAFGIAAGVLASFPSWNWWGFSFHYVSVEFLDFVIGWFLAGLVLAAVVKRTP